jgi:hypothetical protein
MNFVGYVPLRRGLLSHIQEGRLTSNEALTFVVLLLLADKETGSGTINGPALRSFMPGLSHDAAKRALLGLEEKRYIFRQIIPFSKRVYRFWVNLYMPTSGPNKLRQINLSQVFDSGDINDIEFVDPAPQGAPQTAPQGAPQGALHYKKDKEKDKENIPNTSSGMCASESDAVSDSVSHSRQRIAKHTEESACAHKSAHSSALQGATQRVTHCALHPTTHSTTHSTTHPVTHTTTHVNNAPPASAEESGLRWSGYDGAYMDTASGQVISWQEAQTRLGKEKTQ